MTQREAFASRSESEVPRGADKKHVSSHSKAEHRHLIISQYLSEET